jgi:hypothetical protein
MDWTKSYEKLMLLDGYEPYACSFECCNHIARNTLGMMLHREFGDHHPDHQTNHRRRIKP